MLRIIQNTSPAGAKSYYSTADYYTEGPELVGLWRGKGANHLGLLGEVGRKDWDALCDNRIPMTGGSLTQRQRDDRTVGYDFNFHVPKSVSLLYGLSQEERILTALRESVNATMHDIESEMRTRVRSKGRNEDRTTGNMLWGEFIHTTARPVDGVPDPHLHAHCFVFNATWDSKESRFKAGQFRELKRDAPYFEAVFHSRLARRMEELGLPVERTKAGWELRGFTKSTLDKFSRRTASIEKKAREQGITDAAAKGELGAKTRESKRKDLTLEQLQDEWRSRLSPEERDGLVKVQSKIGGERIPEDEKWSEVAASRAVSHCFERNSVVPERKLLRTALRNSFGAASLATVERQLAHEPLINGEREGRRWVTTREVLEEERRMIAFARDGRGTCRPLGDRSYRIQRDWLDDDQRKAVMHVLNSPDRVMVITGRAGTGKTSMAHEAVEAIEANGTKVFMFAPSADASRGVLREQEKFANADTVARLLVDESLQQQIRGQVAWIDEAGLVGTRTMAELFDLAERTGARVILSGDRRQHGSVERGAALRLLEAEAGLVPAEIRVIQRQQGDYKLAVQALSEGRTADGFRQLDKLGWIREVPDGERYKLLAADYVKTTADGRTTCLVVSPTHREGERVTQEIRATLKQTRRLGKDEREVFALQNANLTEAERLDPINYAPGDVIVLHQNAKGYRKGQRVIVGSDALPLSEAARFQVYRPGVLPVAPGDILRMTRNSTTADGNHDLRNGQTFTVKGFDGKGNIVLANGWRVAKDLGFIAHGYCSTSHASQGRSVDRVLIGQSAESFGASSREQFYVSASRGKKGGVTVYTDDKNALMEAVSRSDDRLTATEFIARRNAREQASLPRQIEHASSDRRKSARTMQTEREGMSYER